MTKNQIVDDEVARRVAMPYTRELRQEDDGTWFARIREIPGCLTVGVTREDALEMLDDALASWMEAAIEDGAVVPDPDDSRDFSGRFVIRMPRWLHRELATKAEAEGVSLNQLIVSFLAVSSGRQAKTDIPLGNPKGSLYSALPDVKIDWFWAAHQVTSLQLWTTQNQDIESMAALSSNAFVDACSALQSERIA